MNSNFYSNEVYEFLFSWAKGTEARGVEATRAISLDARGALYRQSINTLETDCVAQLSQSHEETESGALFKIIVISSSLDKTYLFFILWPYFTNIEQIIILIHWYWFVIDIINAKDINVELLPNFYIM